MSLFWRRVRNGVINALLVLISFSIPFVVLESYLRTQPAPDMEELAFDVVAGVGPPIVDGVVMRWDEDGNSPVHIRSENPRMVYELRPNLDFHRGRIRTNSMGLRGPEIEPDKPADIYRICVVGDSLTFGWSETEDETYPMVLQRLLEDRRSADGRRFEVVNMGIGGYNAEQELALLEERSLPLQPDLVLVQYCINDVLVGADSGLWHHFTTTGWPIVDFVRLRYLQARELLYSRDIVERSYARMVELMEEAGVPIVFVFFPPQQASINPVYERHLNFAREHGWPVICLYETFASGDLDALMADYYHPSPEGYAIAAEAIARELTKQGFVPGHMGFVRGHNDKGES